jgi:hypothetical protein
MSRGIRRTPVAAYSVIFIFYNKLSKTSISTGHRCLVFSASKFLYKQHTAAYFEVKNLPHSRKMKSPRAAWWWRLLPLCGIMPCEALMRPGWPAQFAKQIARCTGPARRRDAAADNQPPELPRAIPGAHNCCFSNYSLRRFFMNFIGIDLHTNRFTCCYRNEHSSAFILSLGFAVHFPP